MALVTKKDFQGFPCLPPLPGGRFPVSRSRLHEHRVCITRWWWCVCSWHWGALTPQSSGNDSGNLSKPRAGFAAPPSLLQLGLAARNTRLFCGKGKNKKESHWDLSSVKKEWIYSPQDMALLFKHSPQAVVGCSYQKLGMYRLTLCPHL